MTIRAVCPCCQQPLDGPAPFDAAMRSASPTMRRVLEAVVARPGISLQDLLSAVYRNDPTGGPDCAADSLRVTISRENRKLAALGLRVGAPAPGSRCGYYLNKVAQHA